MKKTTKKTSAVKKAAVEPTTYMTETPVSNAGPRKFILLLIILVALIGAGLFVTKKYKGLIIAGTVNGKAVTRWELEKAMNERYAQATFDDLASNLLLQQLAAQNGVSVTLSEVDAEVAATEERLGGAEALAATLERIGYTDKRFREEMSTQVMVRKLAEKLFTIEVTDEEVASFYEENKTLFPDKTFDEVKADIVSNIEQQKLQEQFTTWFQEQRATAAVVSYLK